MPASRAQLERDRAPEPDIELDTPDPVEEAIAEAEAKAHDQ